jgi:hypothetical protein
MADLPDNSSPYDDDGESPELEVNSSRVRGVHDVALLSRPVGAAPLSVRELEKSLRLALLADGKQEREVIAFHLYHRLTLADTAARTRATEAQVRDVLASLESRRRLADERSERENFLSEALSGNARPPRKAAGKKDRRNAR